MVLTAITEFTVYINWFKLSKALTTVVLFALLAGCGKPRKEQSSAPEPHVQDGRTYIEFWHYFSQHQAKPLEDLVARFEKENPDVDVRTIFQGNPGQLKQKLDGSFAAGMKNNPAVSLVYESWTDDFVMRGYVDPVQNHVDGPDGLSLEERADFVKAFVDGNTWDGKLVTLPFNKSIYLLYLNADMLKEAGYTTAPISQGEIADAARKMTYRKGSRIMTYGWGMMPKGESFTTLLLARGGSLVDREGRPQFNSPVALEVMQMLKDLQYPNRHLLVSLEYMSKSLANKMIAMYIYTSASLPYNKADSKGRINYEAAPIPGGEAGPARYLMQGTNLAIYSNKTDAEKKAAWRLVKFLTSPANGVYFATRSGYMPFRYSMMKEPELQTYMSANPDYAMAAGLVLGDKGVQEPKIRAWEGVRNEIDTAVDQLLARSNSDPQALLDTLQKKAEARMTTQTKAQKK